MKSLSIRLFIAGGLVLLLAGARILGNAVQPVPVPAWEGGDQEGVVQALATITARASASPGKTATPEPGISVKAETPASVLPTYPKNPKSSVNAGAPENGESFLSLPAPERAVTADQPGVPTRIAIPSIDLTAPVIPARPRKILLQGDVYDQWVAPNSYAAGWITSSAFLGERGNTVITGHHNEYGEVFGRLVDVEVGDTILVFTSEMVHSYVVSNRMILPELDVPVSQRIENARWIGRSDDERLTLVTCWPKETNTHRLILVAVPN